MFSYYICKKCIAFSDRIPEYLEIVTFNTAFPDLLQKAHG